MPKLESVLADAAQLSVSDRIQLIDALWDTVPDEELPPLSDEWLAEIERRSDEYDRGLVTTTPWTEIKAEALKRLDAAGD